MSRALRIAIVSVTLLIGACSLEGGSVPDRCAHLGDRCRLGEGVLGVCSATDAAHCPSPPCLVCAPQH